jgi:hypothetical protein
VVLAMDRQSIEVLAGRLDRLESQNHEQKRVAERLERENRRLKRTGAAVLIGVILLAIAGADGKTELRALEAKELTVREKDGKSSITLGIAQNGDPTIVFRKQFAGQDKTIRLAMYVARDGVPVWLVLNQSGEALLELPHP